MGGAPLHGVTFYGRAVELTDLRELRRLEPWFYRAPSAHNTQPWLLDVRARTGSSWLRSRAAPGGRRPDAARPAALASARSSRRCSSRAAAKGIARVCSGRRLRRSVGRVSFREVACTRRRSASKTISSGAARAGFEYEPGRVPDDVLAAARRQLGADERLHELAARDVSALFAAADRHMYEYAARRRGASRWLRLSKRDPRLRARRAQLRVPRPVPPRGSALASPAAPAVYPLVRRLALHRAFTAAAKSAARRRRQRARARARRPPDELLDSGRSLLRVWLALSAAGLYTHPLSQIIDCRETEHELARRLGARSGSSAC